jgi:hypothetical protein
MRILLAALGAVSLFAACTREERAPSPVESARASVSGASVESARPPASVESARASVSGASAPRRPVGRTGLRVAIRGAGFLVSSDDSYFRLADPDCKGAACTCVEGAPPSGVTVPAKDGDEDAMARLTACSRSIKCGAAPECPPEARDDREVVLTAQEATPYRTVIATIDALRKQGSLELFPDVMFALPVPGADDEARTLTRPRPVERPSGGSGLHPPIIEVPRSPQAPLGDSDALPVVITSSRIVVGSTKMLAEIALPKDKEHGASAADKERGRYEFMIKPLDVAARAFRTADKARRADAGRALMSEAVVVADPETPYRLLGEVLFTLGQDEFGKFQLMVLQTVKR